MGKLLDAVRQKNKTPLVEDQEKFLMAVEEAYDAIIAEGLKAGETRGAAALTEAINKVVGALPKGKDGEDVTVVSQIRAIAEKIDKIESTQKRGLSSSEKFQLRAMLDANKDKILEAVRSSSPCSVELKFNAARAAAMMTTQNVVTGASVDTGMNLEWDNEIAFIRYPKNFIMDVIRSRQVSKVPQNKVKREQDTIDGDAAITAEGAIKPLVSFTFVDKIYPRVKIAAHMEWTEELELDFESLFNAIIDLFETDVIRKWNNTVLGKVVAAAPLYMTTPLDGTIPSPDIYSVIGAGILQIQQLNYQADSIFMNPADFWAMTLQQDTTGQPKMPPIMVGSDRIAGLSLHVSNSIAAGNILIGQASTWKEEHTNLIVRIGMINDQFIRNEKSIVGEVYSLSYIGERDKAGWVYLDIDTVKEALEIPAA